MKMHQTAIVIQARVGSSRLPGKALADISGKPALQHVIERARSSGIQTYVATTVKEENEPILFLCQSLLVPCYGWNGPEGDVLGRFHAIVRRIGLGRDDVVVRVTADCLGLDPRAIDETVQHLSGYEYAYASPEKGYPRGVGCEAFPVWVLNEVHSRASTTYDREHVTPMMQREYRGAEWSVNRYDGIEMELNTSEDLERIRNVYTTLL